MSTRQVVQYGRRKKPTVCQPGQILRSTSQHTMSSQESRSEIQQHWTRRQLQSPHSAADARNARRRRVQGDLHREEDTRETDGAASGERRSDGREQRREAVVQGRTGKHAERDEGGENVRPQPLLEQDAFHQEARDVVIQVEVVGVRDGCIHEPQEQVVPPTECADAATSRGVGQRPSAHALADAPAVRERAIDGGRGQADGVEGKRQDEARRDLRLTLWTLVFLGVTRCVKRLVGSTNGSSLLAPR
mmetsp:Transcript_16795/g.67768  ORF Transcript_16795/g.67768 Transcript_16795/m.67768 type:complete len:247 (-) Transcript_16795:269-1009(-)